MSLESFDQWLKADGPAALILRQHLTPIEGKEGVVFPPTYPSDENGPRIATRRDGDYRVTVQLPPYKDQSDEKKRKNDDKGRAGYNIDTFDDGTNICQIDSVGSQANRIEPRFKDDPYRALVPQVTVKAGEKSVHLLDAGHRAADAIVRFSDLALDLDEAFRSYLRGDAMPLAKIAPTSLVFGSWDSRATQAKPPRIVRSVIRATNVVPLRRSAQYTPATNYVDSGLVNESHGNDPLSEQGFLHNPAGAFSIGGVQVRGNIYREAILNLVLIRSLRATNDEQRRSLQRYILGLCIVALTMPQDGYLRQDCFLVEDNQSSPRVFEQVKSDGSRESLSLSHDEAIHFAVEAAGAFEVVNVRQATFDPEFADAWLSLKKEDRKKIVAKGAVTKESVKAFVNSPKTPAITKGKTK
jgi:CRISPR-associated protein Csb1